MIPRASYAVAADDILVLIRSGRPQVGRGRLTSPATRRMVDIS
jgi:hypothetical protein